MPKRTIIFVVALMLSISAPAIAQPGSEEMQEESASPTVTVTGVIEEPETTTYMYGSHAITDEASGDRYALRSEEEGLLEDYIDQRATVFGTLVPGYEDGVIEGGPPLVEVNGVEAPADYASNGIDLNRDGVVNQADGEFAAAVSNAAASAADESSRSVLPATGGPQILIWAAPLLLIAGLLLAHRVLH